IGDKLSDRGLIRPRRRRIRVPMSVDPLGPVSHANETWCVDFKGHFELGDKTRCYPLTVTDQHSRYLLKVSAARIGVMARRRGWAHVRVRGRRSFNPTRAALSRAAAR
ncbi:MAG: hypothetical protein WBY94_27850, partial [Polyangiaceae bacterium]